MSQPVPFGAVLRRCADLVGALGCDVFDDLGVELDARKVSIVLAIQSGEAATSTEIARWTGLSRQLVESRLKTLEAGGVLASRPSEQDARKRTYAIADGRREEMARVAEIMADFDDVYRAMWDELGVDLDAGLRAFERALRLKGLTARLCESHPRYRNQLVEVV